MIIEHYDRVHVFLWAGFNLAKMLASTAQRKRQRERELRDRKREKKREERSGMELTLSQRQRKKYRGSRQTD